ncbi:hypothetical protein A2U01_0004013, partial [Trifolium medium]|nr:hypothetical protein [Trifolium medium]
PYNELYSSAISIQTGMRGMDARCELRCATIIIQEHFKVTGLKIVAIKVVRFWTLLEGNYVKVCLDIVLAKDLLLTFVVVR